MIEHRKEMLRIKRRMLVDESRLLRKRAAAAYRKSKVKNNPYNPAGQMAIYVELHHRRTVILRKEARLAHLTMAYLNGTPYLKVEQKCHDKPNSWLLSDMIVLFSRPPNSDYPYQNYEGRKDSIAKIEKWMEES